VSSNDRIVVVVVASFLFFFLKRNILCFLWVFCRVGVLARVVGGWESNAELARKTAKKKEEKKKTTEGSS
jgi:uncharacterized membrane protein